MRVLRWMGFFVLAVYGTTHVIISNPWVELILYNAVVIALIIGIMAAPHISDRIAKPLGWVINEDNWAKEGHDEDHVHFKIKQLDHFLEQCNLLIK